MNWTQSRALHNSSDERSRGPTTPNAAEPASADATLGEVIPGLYVAGADALCVMSGYYPAGGIDLGPAMVFEHIAATSAVIR